MPTSSSRRTAPLLALGAVALLTLTGCQDDVEGDGTDGDGASAPSAPQSESRSADPQDPDDSASQDDPQNDPQDADTTTVTSAEGTYSWEVPEGLILRELSVEQHREWPDGEPAQQYTINGPSGQRYGSVVINTSTDADGGRAMHREVLDARRLEDAAQGDSETWAQSVLHSNCLTTDRSGSGDEGTGASSGPQDCEYRIAFTLLSVGPDQDPEDTSVWAFFHSSPEEQAGNVLMNAGLPAQPEGGDPLWLSREDAEDLADTPEYRRLWDLFTSFTLHEEAAGGDGGEEGAGGDSEGRTAVPDDGGDSRG